MPTRVVETEADQVVHAQLAHVGELTSLDGQQILERQLVPPNVVAKYLFETSHRFAGMQPNSDLGDYSRLSCGAEDTQLGPSLVPGSRDQPVNTASRELLRG